MIARNVESRILKLEAQRKRPDEILVIWRRPGQEVADVIAGTAFVRGDRVICSEWFGEGEPPLPKWRQACHMCDFDPTEQDSIYRCLDRLVEARRDSDSTVGPSRPAPYLAHMSDIDLLHATLGVETSADQAALYFRGSVEN